jgi:hypothetical protein
LADAIADILISVFSDSFDILSRFLAEAFYCFYFVLQDLVMPLLLLLVWAGVFYRLPFLAAFRFGYL